MQTTGAACDTAPRAPVAVEGRIEDARLLGPPRAPAAPRAARAAGPTVLRAVFFNAHASLGARLSVGASVRLVGALRQGAQGPELVHPKVIDADARLRPIESRYPAVGSLASGTVARALAAAMERAHTWADPVPPDAAARLGLMPSAEALRRIHQPGERIDAAGLRALAEGRSDAHRRLGFEELLAVSVAVERARRSAGPARAFAPDGDALVTVGERLGIVPTPFQREAADTLRVELAGAAPMRRLLVGDVGAGKTAVALAATLATVRAGGSVAWLCPTTLVAEQHARSVQAALAGRAGPWRCCSARRPRGRSARRCDASPRARCGWWWARTGCWSATRRRPTWASR
ncbi:MAG: hypothetical protein U0325_30070 [Polyangiales bacterium]